MTSDNMIGLTDLSRHISSSMLYHYNRFNYLLSDCVTDNYRYVILAIFKYRNIELADIIAFTVLGD